jgi:hypothetical protein
MERRAPPLNHLMLMMVALVVGSSACDADERASSAQAYAVTDGDKTIFYIGSPNVVTMRETIDAGGKIFEKWTRIEIPASVPQGQSMDLRQTVGIKVSHEFPGTDPYVIGDTETRWFRLDVTTGAETRGTLDISADGIGLRLHFEGVSNVWEGPEPIYVAFDIITGATLRTNIP